MAKYSKGAGKKVETTMREMKEGKLKTGTGKKVTNPKQAIAIGLSEARESGAKVPAKKGAAKKPGAKSSRKTASKGAAKKGASKKTASKNSSKRATKKASSKGKK
jgi:Family of unknown function (DUF6496)